MARGRVFAVVGLLRRFLLFDSLLRSPGGLSWEGDAF